MAALASLFSHLLFFGGMEPALTHQQAKFTDDRRSAFEIYRELSVGNSSLGFLCYNEFLQFIFGNWNGLPGFAARSILYPTLFKSCGKRPGIGRGVTIRNPKQISIGNKLLLDEYAVLDVRGGRGEISIGDRVSIGRFSIITAKDGSISLAAGANIGTSCRIATQSKVVIGESVLVAAYAYIGPGNHQPGDDGTPLISREMEIKGGVEIGAHAWIGTRATILDGVTVGERAIVGAHSLVRENVPAGAIVAGTPAKIIGQVGK